MQICRAYPEEIYEQCRAKGQGAYSKLHKKRGTISRRINDGSKLKFPVEAIFLACKKVSLIFGMSEVFLIL